MVFVSVVKGKVLDVKKTRKGKTVVVVYDNESSRVANVFTKNDDFERLEDVEIPVRVITDNYYCVEIDNNGNY